MLHVESSIQSARAAARAAALWRTRGELRSAAYKNSATCFSVPLFLLSVFSVDLQLVYQDCRSSRQRSQSGSQPSATLTSTSS